TLSLDAPLPAGCELPSAGGADPAKPVLAASGSRELQAALARLPQRQRSILALHYLHELSLHAIGRRMSVSPQRISQLHLAALARLRRNLVRA
ncbi:MAG: sigma-70 family RNA polymerase sigma factor, partial [Candidatus Dormibacteria bacterium]